MRVLPATRPGLARRILSRIVVDREPPATPVTELRPETWTLLMVAVMRLPVGPDPGILPGSGP